MQFRNIVSVPLVAFMLTAPVFANSVVVDYDHSENFTRVKTYSWSKVSTANSLWDKRVEDSIDRELTAKGWTKVPSGGDVQLVAAEKNSVHQEFDTYYDGFGGRRFGRMGESTTSVDSYKVGTLIVSMLDSRSNQLVWRASTSSDLSGNPSKDAKKLNKDVDKMFKQFPPKAGA
jgi:Domain of unknown function (DUF4136)